MPCFRPLPAFRSFTPNPETGKYPIVFTRKEALHPKGTLPPLEVTIPCGQCRFCKLEHSRQWAIRCMHEASLYQNNCFLTLTYDPDKLPPNSNLDYNHPVLFMKSLREKFGSGIRSFGCAEYGEKKGRPHYHLCVFNHDFFDKQFFKTATGYRNCDQNKLYTSPTLSKLWTHGHSSIGTLTFESAAYVARYVTKKITGDAAKAHYERTDEATGEIHTLLPERAICVSRRPGIGKPYYEKYGDFSRHHDFIQRSGTKMRPPKYYDRLHELADPSSFARVKKARRKAGELGTDRHDAENEKAYSDFHQLGGFDAGRASPKLRLHTMEEVLDLNAQSLKRNLENDT